MSKRTGGLHEFVRYFNYIKDSPLYGMRGAEVIVKSVRKKSPEEIEKMVGDEVKHGEKSDIVFVTMISKSYARRSSTARVTSHKGLRSIDPFE